LLWLGNKLHGGVVDNHAVELNAGVAVLLLGDSLASVKEETVTELHNVGLVDTGDLLEGCQRASRIGMVCISSLILRVTP